MSERELSILKLRTLGFKGSEVYLAELIPAVEMAWADGVVGPNEIAVLEAYCEALIESLNRRAGARLFSLSKALTCLRALIVRRFSPAQRQQALMALRGLWMGPAGLEHRKRMVEWAEAVAAVDGSPVWDTRELFWLQRVRTVLEVQ